MFKYLKIFQAEEQLEHFFSELLFPLLSAHQELLELEIYPLVLHFLTFNGSLTFDRHFKMHSQYFAKISPIYPLREEFEEIREQC